MADWKYFKLVRKFYEITREETDDEEGRIEFTYCNWTYWGNSVNLVNMLTEEIVKDFPNVSTNDIHIQKRSCAPFELTLNVTYTLSEIQSLDLSRFEKLPEDFW